MWKVDVSLKATLSLSLVHTRTFLPYSSSSAG